MWLSPDTRNDPMRNSLERKMKLARYSGQLSLLALAVLMSASAVAQDGEWYGGFNLGQSRAVIDNAGITRGLLGNGLTITSIDDKNKDTGFKLLGGYQYNRNFALEAGYFDLGKFGYTATTTPTGTLRGEIKLRGLNFDAVGFLPFNEKFSGFGRVGATYVEASDNFTATGAVNVSDPSPSKRDVNFKVGLGLQYDFTPKLAMRLEAERYRVNDAVGNHGDIDLFSVGLILRFGKKAPEPAPYTPPPPPPEPVAVAPEPVVVAAVVAPVVVQPVKRVLRKVTISVDSDFDFNKSSLNPAGKQVLDQFLADLPGMNYSHIAITGNTDRIGSDAYNMKLSVKRAEVVQSYLVATGGLAADKLVTTGVGKTEPETKPGTCVGNKITKELIKCLQPDRRVDIEVHGTR
jgi:OOP family OmpA-OmpF porin